MQPIIKVENLNKKYKIGDKENYYTLRDKLANPLKLFNKSKSREFWALKNINLEIIHGEAIGIIGRNGAGKSTLLKILSQITPPTTGKITMRGRVASLLEVGTGFHPELTGRENIFLNGAILGMTRKEIKSKFDQIVAFAGIEKFLDTPVKRYSSGMYVRLAFAVAAHLESEILIVDEVLAVGDAQFQKKCLGKMDEVTKKEGRTVLFVSHNMGAVKRLCNKAILLENGNIISFGKTSEVIDLYENTSVRIGKTGGIWINKIKGRKGIDLEKITITNLKNKQSDYIYSNQDIKINFTVYAKHDIDNVKIGFDLIKEGTIVFRSEQVDSIDFHKLEKNIRYVFSSTIPSNLLNAGEYYIRPLLSIHCVESLIDFYEPVIKFHSEIHFGENHFHSVLNETNHPGSVFPKLKWNLSINK